MSVLNDVSTTDGSWIRAIARRYHFHDAGKMMDLCRFLPPTRMDSNEYRVSANDIDMEMVKSSNSHWRDKDANFCWGLPGGSFKDYVGRIRNREGWWEDGAFYPPTRLELSEVEARDMLLTANLFPFYKGTSKTSDMMTTVIEPIIRGSRGKTIVAGTNAIASLISSIDHDTLLGSAVVNNCKKSPKDRSSDIMEFSGWLAAFCVARVHAPDEGLRALDKTQKCNPKMSETAMKYVSLADFANTVEHVIRQSGRRGYLGKRLRKTKSTIAALEEEILMAKNDHLVNSRREDLEHYKRSAFRPFFGNMTDRGVVYGNSRSEGLRIVADQGIAMVHVIGGDEILLLTPEDLKNIRFVAMSHSMWHLYGASISMEYAPTIKLPSKSHSANDLAAAAGQLATQVVDVIATVTAGMKYTGMVRQKVASIEECDEGLKKIWRLYIDVIDEARRLKMTDYVGRYLHEMYAIYTATLGGDLATSTVGTMREEFAAKYMALGFDARHHSSQLVATLSAVPITLAQDFGRLSKIVYAYDTNPAYAFIKRVNDMQTPNPCGRAEFAAEGSYTIHDHTQAENIAREAAFKSATRVMLAVADMKSRTMAAMEPKLAEKYEAWEWPDLLKEVVTDRALIKCGATLRGVADFVVPDAMKRECRKQAREFLKGGDLPTNVYAGAYINITDVFAYKERGDPDIAILKATSLPPGGVSLTMSTVASAPRQTPTRDRDGQRAKGSGNMISAYIRGEFPTRAQSIDRVRKGSTISTNTVKIETNKFPLKTRIITAFEAPARRVMSEYEANNGRVLKGVPGFCVGADPGAVKRKIYASLKDDVRRGCVRIYGSLDLSSWSAGMNWDVQEWCNSVLKDAYDGGDDNFDVLNKCTKGSATVMSCHDIHIGHRNTLGSNYEGVDGKRNTLLHCTLWYLSRCDAYAEGLDGTLRAFLYIDDGSFSMEVPKEEAAKSMEIIKECLVRIYCRYGFNLDVFKTVFSRIYMQFLNEIYHHGAHIGYGFRALCHTGAQTFPEVATVCEELGVISGGIRGASVSGGHPLRLLVGFGCLMYLYKQSVIGSLGKNISTGVTLADVIMICTPTNAGGFGMPHIIQLFSNLAGHTDCEKHSSVRTIYRFLSRLKQEVGDRFYHMAEGFLMMSAKVTANRSPDRLTIAHPASTLVSARGRDRDIALGALAHASHPPARKLITEFLESSLPNAEDTFPKVFINAAREYGRKLPTAVVEKALASDPHSSVATLVKKIASSRIIHMFLSVDDIRKYKRTYGFDARKRSRDVWNAMVM